MQYFYTKNILLFSFEHFLYVISNKKSFIIASIVKRKSSYSVVYYYKNQQNIKKQKWESFKALTEAETRKILAVIYILSETAKLNNLRPYYYFKHLLTELPKPRDEKGNIDFTKLDYLLPWSTELPAECRKV